MSVRLEWYGDLAVDLVKVAAGIGLSNAAEAVKAESNAAAPTESAYLVGSSGTDVDRENLEASVYYDPQGAPKGGKPVYAIVRHEALREGGAPKYLERPVIAARGAVAEELATQIRRML